MKGKERREQNNEKRYILSTQEKAKGKEVR